jgi:hypothetical protein
VKLLVATKCKNRKVQDADLVGAALVTNCRSPLYLTGASAAESAAKPDLSFISSQLSFGAWRLTSD